MNTRTEISVYITILTFAIFGQSCSNKEESSNSSFVYDQPEQHQAKSVDLFLNSPAAEQGAFIELANCKTKIEISNQSHTKFLLNYLENNQIYFDQSRCATNDPNDDNGVNKSATIYRLYSENIEKYGIIFIDNKNFKSTAIISHSLVNFEPGYIQILVSSNDGSIINNQIRYEDPSIFQCIIDGEQIQCGLTEKSLDSCMICEDLCNGLNKADDFVCFGNALKYCSRLRHWGAIAACTVIAGSLCAIGAAEIVEQTCGGICQFISACKPKCGDGNCDKSENCSTCELDCGICPEDPDPQIQCPEGTENQAGSCVASQICIENEKGCLNNSQPWICKNNNKYLLTSCEPFFSCNNGDCKAQSGDDIGINEDDFFSKQCDTSNGILAAVKITIPTFINMPSAMSTAARLDNNGSPLTVVSLEPVGIWKDEYNDCTYAFSNGDLIIASFCPLLNSGLAHRFDSTQKRLALIYLAAKPDARVSDVAAIISKPFAYYSTRPGTYERSYPGGDMIEWWRVNKSGQLFVPSSVRSVFFHFAGYKTGCYFDGMECGIREYLEIAGNRIIGTDEREVGCTGPFSFKWNVTGLINSPGSYGWNASAISCDNNEFKGNIFWELVYDSPHGSSATFRISEAEPGQTIQTLAIESLSLPACTSP